MFSVSVVSRATPEQVWPWLAESRRWSAWAPHLRGAIGLGSPEVRGGRLGAVIVVPGLVVPVRITAKIQNTCWEWRSGPVRFRHSVEAHPDGSLITFDVFAPGPLEAVVKRTYGPVMGMVARRLARIAVERPLSGRP